MTIEDNIKKLKQDATDGKHKIVADFNVMEGERTNTLDQLKASSDLNIPDNDYNNVTTTLLHCAAKDNNLETVKYLLKYNIAPNIPDAGNWTALNWARNDRATEVVNYLIGYQVGLAGLDKSAGLKECDASHMDIYLAGHKDGLEAHG